MTKHYRVDFDRLKMQADMRTVLAHYDNLGWISLAGLNVAGTGSHREQITIRCPFHDDRKPSLSVHTGKGVWNCKGCGCSGNVLDLVQQLETAHGAALPIREAAEKLASICGIDLDGAQSSSEPRRGPKGEKRTLSRPKTSSSADGGSRRQKRAFECEPEPNEPLSDKFLHSFRTTLVTDERYERYLEARGFDPEAAHEAFGLALQTGGRMMRDRLAIPIADPEGKILAYAGRWVGNDASIPGGEGKYKLPKAEHFRPTLALYNHRRAFEAKHVTVVEGYFGAMRLDLMGLPAVAVMGNSISAGQIELLKAFPHLQAVTVMLDGGEATQSLTDRMCGLIARAAPKFRVRAVELPGREQPDTVDAQVLEALFPARTRQLARQSIA